MKELVFSVSLTRKQRERLEKLLESVSGDNLSHKFKAYLDAQTYTPMSKERDRKFTFTPKQREVYEGILKRMDDLESS